MLAKKKQILTATLLIALVAAVAVNWYYTRPGTTTQDGYTSQSENSAAAPGDTVLVAGTVENSEEALSQNEEQAKQAQLDEKAAQEYFAEAKLKRTNTHDEVITQIEKVLSSDNFSQEDKSRITQSLLDYKAALEAETDCENLIKAKVGGECLVIINDANAQVVLQKGLLNDTVLLQITEIFEKNTNISAENLTIIETK